jgi:long-chain acyl-CoA synthetase
VGRVLQDNSVAIECGTLVLPGRSPVSGSDILRRAGALATELGATGVRPGDRVALATADPEAFFVAFAACFASGFVAVVLDPTAAGDELRRMIERAEPIAAVLDAAVVQALTTVAGVPRALATIVVGEAAPPRRSWRPWRSAAAREAAAANFEAITAAGATLDWPDHSADADAYIMFTSGSTSTPKAVVISRGALVAHVRTLASVFGYGPSATLLHYLPFHHTDGLVHGPAAALLTGLGVVRPGAFTAQATATLPALLRDYRVTHFLAVPTIFSMIQRTLGQQPEVFRTSSFRHAVSTAGFLHEELWTSFEDTFGVRLSNFYGMTETVSGSIYCGPGDATYRRGTLGKPVDCAVRLVDGAGAPTPAGEIGRLEVAGAHLMSGYLSDPQATAAVLHDGWLDTGDLCRVDGDGFLVFAGRRKSIIKRGGITIYPEDVRQALDALPWVREAEIVGAPDPTFEQIVVACVVVDPGRTAADVHAACAERLAPERRPDRVVLMDALPRGASGKVQREALLERAAASPAPDAGDPSVAGRVRAVAAGVFQVDPAVLSDTTGPADLPNWDSYAQIELAMALERQFGLRLSPKELMQLRSIGHAVDVISRRLGVAPR